MYIGNYLGISIGLNEFDNQLAYEYVQSTENDFKAQILK